MNENLPVLYLARYGETAWSITRQHTGLTDLPLTERGDRNAQRLGKRLAGIAFTKIFMSPLKRAARICELAGFGARPEADPNLVEWNHGDYEGLRTAEIHLSNPVGNCFATVARMENRRNRWARVLIAPSTSCAPSKVTCLFSQAATF